MAQMQKIPQFIPSYKVLPNLGGGLNLSMPPDQIADNQTPDAKNVVFLNGVLQVDTGLVSFGNRIVGSPQQIIQVESTTGLYTTCLVTTVGFFTYYPSGNSWVLQNKVLESTQTTNTTYIASGPWSIDFTDDFGPPTTTPLVLPVASVTGFVVGQIIGVELYSSSFYYSIITAVDPVGLTITCADPLDFDNYIAPGAQVQSYASFHGGSYPISYTLDPTTDSLIWTNGVDPVQSFSQGILAPLAGMVGVVDTCRVLLRFYGYTLAINTTEQGNVYPYRVRRSTGVSSQDWTSPGSGFDDLIDTPDAITSALLLDGQAVLGRENSVMTGSYWGTALQTFYWQYSLNNMGYFGLRAAIAARGASVFVAHSGIYGFATGFTVTDIGNAIFNYMLGPFGDLNPNATNAIFTLFVSELNEFWVFYPSGSNTQCNKLLRYSFTQQSWFVREFPFTFSSGGFAYSVGLQTWEQVHTTWATTPGTWSSRVTLGNFPFILLTDTMTNRVYAYNYTAQDDDGTQIEWYYVTKDFPTIDQLLMLDGFVGFGKSASPVLVEVSNDQGISWTTAGIFNFGPSYSRQVVDYQLTNGLFRFRLSGVGSSTAISQLAIRYLPASEF
jgi:hypothetical protein